MAVYVDLLFLLNTLINYLLLRGSAAMGGSPARIRRLLTGAAIGGTYAVACVLPGGAFLQTGWVQAAAAAAMILAAFGWKKTTLKQGLFFLALSFAFGGAVLLLVQAAEPDCVLIGGRAYYGVTFPALLLLAGACYGLAAVVLRGWGSHTGGDLAPLELELQSSRVCLQALRDTGNTLRDPVSGQPILVAEWQVLCRLLPEAALHRSDFSDPAGLVEKLTVSHPDLRFRLIPYGAVGTSSGLLPAVRCQINRGKRKERMLVAFTATELSVHRQFEALMGGMVT